MSKSYSQFTYEDLEAINIDFGLKNIAFSGNRVEPSEFLKKTLETNLRLPLGSETAKSQFITAPILSEILVKNNFEFTFFAGYSFDVDKTKGLKGICDYILTKKPDSPMVDAPIFLLVEAKKDDIEDGIAQCAAEMVAAQIFNERRNNNTTIIFGAVTSGLEWLFLKLEGNFVSIDKKRYYLNDLSELLGVLQDVVDFYK